MGRKSIEKEALDNEDERKTCMQTISLFIRSNWLALIFALIICIITIVVTPIVYSIQHNVNSTNNSDLTWNTKGVTLISQNTFLNGINNSLGIISSLAFDSQSNLYLCDQTMHRILQYSSVQMNLILIAGYANGTNGSDVNSFNSPNDIYIDSSNQIYVADTLNHRIIKRTKDSNQGTIIVGTGTSGSASNQLNSPMSLTMGGDCLYIADYGNNRIIQYNLTTSTANIYIGYDTTQLRNTYVYTPISIRYHSPTTSLVIGQQLGYNVVRWTLGGKNWNLIAGSVSSDLNGTSRTLFNRICSVAVDTQMDTYIADCDNQRIQFFQGDGTKGRTIAGVIQAIGNNSYIFNQPNAIVLNTNLDFYVADSINYRIQMFQRTS
ncbi:unnamed protein product [Adineta steineri]|uniref:NHL repeat containing protein n=1 Tax=Adineta steineri TaxID=433720 RepID=A0A818IG25_9BILA|nr:unnamed protein product [Adineta steineri]CAF3519104.1 unnamed protein product [Adineta steineri]